MAETGPWLVIGLGNLGADYAGHRHNVGAMVIDELAGRTGGRFKAHKSRADIIEGRLAGERAILAKPRTYMNDSGGPAAGLRDFFDVSTDWLIVVHDELDLDYGVLRVKYGGGDNGHNGLKSLRRSLGTGDYFRVRLGIGRPPGRQDPADFVLRDFSGTERKDLALNLGRGADAVESLIASGLAATQNAYND